MLIREAREDELDGVSDMMVAAYREFAEGLPPEAWRAYRDDVAAVRARLADSSLIVALDGERPVGALTLYGPGAFPMWPASCASFRLLAVAPAARGQGIARVLVAEAIERSRTLGAQALGIHTTPAMTAGLALYESLGFVRDERFDFEPPGFSAGDGSPLRVCAYRLDLA